MKMTVSNLFILKFKAFQFSELLQMQIRFLGRLWSLVNNAGLGGFSGWNWGDDPVGFYEKVINDI